MWAKMFAPLLYQINAMCSSGFYFLYAVFYVKLVSAAFLQSFDKQNTKNGRRRAKPSYFLPLKMGTAGFKSYREPFFEMIPFFCTPYPQTS